MALKFKRCKDVTLENAPLSEVICQIRFAPLLEIIKNLPTEFQKRIRARFPKFKVRAPISKDIQPLPSDYVFTSSNELSSVILDFSFIALSTKEYSHWDIFKKEIDSTLKAFISSYGDIFASRIGLRYINELTPASTEKNILEDFLNIINDDLSCLILNKSWSLPKKVVHHLVLPDEEKELTINVIFEENQDTKLILDYDYSILYDPPIEMKRNQIMASLEEFHKKIYDAFRWSLKDNTFDNLKEKKDD